MTYVDDFHRGIPPKDSYLPLIGRGRRATSSLYLGHRTSRMLRRLRL